MKKIGGGSKKRAGRPPDNMPPLKLGQIEFIKKNLLLRNGGKKVWSIPKLAKRFKCAKDTVAKARDGYYDSYFEKRGSKAMARKPETVFKEKVIAYLKKLPRTWYVVVDQRALRGTPDLICCINGHLVGIELKASISETHNSARFKLQQYNLDKIRKAKGFGFVIYPENWDKARLRLKDIAEGKYYDLVDIRTSTQQTLQRSLDKIR
jgi:hypothetical protein